MGASIRLGLSRRADSDTPAVDIIGPDCRVEFGKILCYAPAYGIDGPKMV